MKLAATISVKYLFRFLSSVVAKLEKKSNTLSLI